MKSIEEIKYSKKLEPYFLWYLKSNLMMPRIVQMVIRGGNIEHTNGLDLMLNHERSTKALLKQLEKHVETEDISHVFNDVCKHYLQTIGPGVIFKSSPELLIIQDCSRN